jgi:hypothetical protein
MCCPAHLRRPSCPPCLAVASLQVHEESVTLQGGERVIVHLRVVPLRPGSLHVNGITWLLNGAAHGLAAFQIPRLRASKSGTSGSK